MYNWYIEIKITFLETVFFTPLVELKIFFLYLSVNVDRWPVLIMHVQPK